MTVKILAFAGSTRTKSFNKMLIRIAAEGAKQAGAEVEVLDFRDMPMPLYDGDLEERDGIPTHAKRFKEKMKACDGFLISAPEYNSSISGVLKNAIDWASRPEPGEPSLAAFTGKVAGLMSASTGALGGLRGLVHVRAILGNINTLVIPQQLAVGRATDAFDDSGRLRDEKQRETVLGIGRRVVEVAARLQA